MGAMGNSSSKLVKIKLSGINMSVSKNSMIGGISQLAKNCKNMISLDLSWGKLMAKELAQIAQSLSINAKNLRNLNLSYNKLAFESTTKLKYLEEFPIK